MTPHTTLNKIKNVQLIIFEHLCIQFLKFLWFHLGVLHLQSCTFSRKVRVVVLPLLHLFCTLTCMLWCCKKKGKKGKKCTKVMPLDVGTGKGEKEKEKYNYQVLGKKMFVVEREDRQDGFPLFKSLKCPRCKNMVTFGL